MWISDVWIGQNLKGKLYYHYQLQISLKTNSNYREMEFLLNF